MCSSATTKATSTRFAEGRLRGVRRRRASGHFVHDGCDRRPRHQRACCRRRRRRRKESSCRRRAPATTFGPHLRVLRRRSASAVPQYRPRARAVPEDFERTAARRRHVGHGLERSFVDLDSDDLRQEPPAGSHQEDDRQRVEAGRHHQRVVRPRWPERNPLPRARRVLDRRGNAEEPGSRAQPAQGARVCERRLRLRAVRRTHDWA